MHAGRARGGWGAPPPHPRAAGAHGDAGSVLLETALAIPLLMAVAVALAWGIALGGQVDGAR